MRAKVTYSNCSVHEGGFSYTSNSVLTLNDRIANVLTNKFVLFNFSAPFGSAGSNSSNVSCVNNTPYTLEWVQKSAGGTDLYINGATTPAVSLSVSEDPSTYTNKPFLLTTFENGATISFDDVVIENDAPTVPTVVNTTPMSGQVNLSWSADPADLSTAIGKLSVHTDYIIEYKPTVSSTWTTFSDGVSTSTTTNVTGLTNGTSYDFRISSINAAGTSSPSTSTSATPTNVATSTKIYIQDNFNSGSFNTSIWQEIENATTTSNGATTGSVKINN
jgi:hypothetical protein